MTGESMKAKPRRSWLTFRTRETLTETMDLTDATQRGAYLTLLAHCWDDGSLPNDLDKLLEMSGLPSKWRGLSGNQAMSYDAMRLAYRKAMRFVLERFFELRSDGRWHHAAMDEYCARCAETLKAAG